jgi:predicted DNA-binding protein (MmcQ/YjbR family)
MNKQHWNTVLIERLPEGMVLELTDQSYDLVVNSLPKKIRQELEVL